MKVWVALLLFVVHQSFAENVTFHDVLNIWKEQTGPAMSECISKTKVEQEVVDEFYEDGKLPDDDRFKCYHFCIAKTAHIMNTKGEISPEELTEHFDYIDSELAQKCAKVENRRLCPKAYLLVKCIVDDVSKRYP